VTALLIDVQFETMVSPSDQQPVNDSSLGWLSLPAMRYPNEYVWFVLFSSLDIMLTWAILKRDGTEVNPIAYLVIRDWDLLGAIVFKFSLTLVVIVVCEIVGRQRDRTGRSLSQAAVVVSALPVIYSLALLLIHTFQPDGV
jgi:hypothetical protein